LSAHEYKPTPRALSASSEPAGVVQDLKAIEAQVGQAREILSDAIRKIASSFQVLDQQTASQKTVIKDVLDVISGAGGKNANHISATVFARETSQVLHQFTDLLATVSKQSVRTVYRIDDMARELDAVFKLVASVNEISEETFILAVNATIEAAHADGGGRSFSVIASNVRELSKKTRRFNEQIESQIVKARQTVNEVREIIGDMASRDLNVALAGKERVQEMLLQLQNVERFVASSLDKATDSTGRIRNAADEALTALQFEDILMQLLQEVSARVADMQRSRTEDSSRTAEPLAPASDTRRSQGRLALDTIQQRSVVAGDIELF
jgi:methyl-accepting chemotaxis protein